MRSELFAGMGADLNSNPLTVYAPTPLCDTSPCGVQIVLQNLQAVDFASLEPPTGNFTVNTTCAAGQFSDLNATCPNGKVVNLHCNGTEGVVSQICPVIHYSSACNVVGNTNVATGENTGCSVVSYTDTEIVCLCDVMHSAPQRRSLSVSGYNFTEPEGYSVSYVSMLSATADTFVSTILTADNLNASTITKGWRALATLGALAAAVVFGLFWSHHTDNIAKRVNPAPDQSAALVKKESEAKKTKVGKKARFNFRTKKALVNAELAIVEESLPRVLSSRTFTDRFLEEVKQHHRWFGIIFYYSDAFPRVLRVVSLATNAIVMLFIQSITYNLTNPDDGSCALLTTQEECIVPTSPFATGESKCAWVQDSAGSSTDGTCMYIEPDNSIRIILFVAIFCAIVTTPIALTADWIIGNILSAPTKTEVHEEAAREAAGATSLAASAGVLISSRQRLPADPADITNDALAIVPADGAPVDLRKTLVKRKNSSSAALMSYIGMFNSAEKAMEDKLILAACRAELLMLSTKLKKYRDTLPPDQLEEFNRKRSTCIGLFLM
jgi:hypothetical protein